MSTRGNLNLALRDARKSYSKSMEIIKKVCSEYQQRIENDVDFSRNVMMRRFDYMIQFIMMDVAHANGDRLDGMEIAMISRRIVQNGDILYYLRMNTQIDCSWDDFKTMTEKEYEEIYSEAAELVRNCADMFMVPFVAVYKEFQEQYIEEIDSCVNDIIFAVMMVDGRATEKEIEQAKKSKEMVLIDRWNDILKKYLSGEMERSDNDKTLRDYYIQKILLDEDQYEFKPLDIQQELPQKIILGRSSSWQAGYMDADKRNFFSTIVYIEVYKNGDLQGAGSGFVITEDGYVITCNHVVEDADEIFVKISDGDKNINIYRVETVLKNRLLDMAIIKLEPGKYHFISIDIERRYPDIGEPIEIYGYPMGSIICDDVINLNVSLTRGYVSSTQVLMKLRRIFIDGDARHGNSGGPIISMKTGKVIGMLHGSIMSAQSEYDVDNICYTIPLKYLKKYFITKEENSGKKS